MISVDLAVDTETTGVDFNHGTMPYFVTTCDKDMEQKFWEWDVDPVTRMPEISNSDKRAVRKFLVKKNSVLHNSVFDVKALSKIGVNLNWDNIEDTLAMSHLLSTNTPHDLTHLVLRYLNINVLPYENRVKCATNLARQICKNSLPDWRIAGPGMSDMPSVKSAGSNSNRGSEQESYWKADMWLLKAICKHEPKLLPTTYKDGAHVKKYRAPDGKLWRPIDGVDAHPWSYLCEEYANSDTAGTILLWRELKKEIEKSGFSYIYAERRKILRIVYLMETKGISLSGKRLEELKTEYQEHVSKSEDWIYSLAESMDYDLEMPKGPTNESLNRFCFGHEPKFKGDGVISCRTCGKPRPKTDRGVDGWKERSGSDDGMIYCKKKCFEDRLSGSWLDLPVVARSEKTQQPTTNAAAINIYKDILDPGEQLDFINHLSNKRKLGKSLEYMSSYEKFWVSDEQETRKRKLRNHVRQWFRLYPSLNPFGTDTLRWSSHNPSQQVISKKKDHNGRNLRYIFGPKTGRVWYSLDYDNLELRIPAYECGEPAMLELFEHPEKAPYFGSYHLLIFSILHPDKYDHDDPMGLLKAKEKYPHIYGWVKNGNFAELYGAVDTGDGRGTADRAFHIPGAQSIIARKLTEKNKLNKKYIQLGNKHGYVETMPDKSIDPLRGYPIQCKKSKWNRVVETTPLNYHVQGTACWVMMRAMIKIQDLLDKWNAKLPEPQYFMVMNIHDEVVLDFPESTGKKDTNLPKMKAVRRAMESIGKDIGVRLTCGLDRHDQSWLSSVAL